MDATAERCADEDRVAVPSSVIREVEQFLYREARLLDERRFDEWLGLMAPDLHYWMPTRINRLREKDEDWAVSRELAAEDELGIFDEHLLQLTLRVRCLPTGLAWAEDPPSRTRHLVHNVEVAHGENDGELLVHSNFVVFQSRLESTENWFVGQRQDVLRRVDGGLLLAKRTIILDSTVVPCGSISIFF